MFCSLQKDSYLCSVNKKTTKHMIKYQLVKNGNIKELSEEQYSSLIYSLLLLEISYSKVIERRFKNGICELTYSVSLL